jgi:putative transposase
MGSDSIEPHADKRPSSIKVLVNAVSVTPIVNIEAHGGGFMARLPRYSVPGQPQHVNQRGNNRSALFATTTDYMYFHECLRTACEQHGCQIHAYVFMTNHVHLLMTPQSESGIGKVMQSVGRRYVQYFNFSAQRTGTLWEGRYKATVIDTERYLLTCYRYVELNPVRAGMVAAPGEYRWSSFGANALGRLDPLVTSHGQYLALGADPDTRQAAYRALFPACIDGHTLGAIREATNKGWALGTDRFRDEVTRLLKRRARPVARGGDRRSRNYRDQATERPSMASGSMAINGINGVRLH